MNTALNIVNIIALLIIPIIAVNSASLGNAMQQQAAKQEDKNYADA